MGSARDMQSSRYRVSPLSTPDNSPARARVWVATNENRLLIFSIVVIGGEGRRTVLELEPLAEVVFLRDLQYALGNVGVCVRVRPCVCGRACGVSSATGPPTSAVRWERRTDLEGAVLLLEDAQLGDELLDLLQTLGLVPLLGGSSLIYQPSPVERKEVIKIKIVEDHDMRVRCSSCRWPWPWCAAAVPAR
jgi:hypothetical protein